MAGWSADFTNNPLDDYNLIAEITYEDETIAIISKENSSLNIRWFAHSNDYNIPLEWLSCLLIEAKDRL